MEKIYIQKALKLQLRPSFSRHDFIIGRSNLEAIKWIDKYPQWKDGGLIIIGPKSSGKSHLASVFKFKSSCTIKQAHDVNKEKINLLDMTNIAIENIDKITNFKFFLNIINLVREKKKKILLTSRLSLNHLNIDLLDLNSRLLTFPQANILLPTDDVLSGIAMKLSKDKGLILSEKVLIFIINHIERSYAAINKFVNMLDKVTMEKKQKITLNIVKDIIELYF